MKTLLFILISFCAVAQPLAKPNHVSSGTLTNAKYVLYSPIRYEDLADTSHIILSLYFDGDYIVDMGVPHPDSIKKKITFDIKDFLKANPKKSVANYFWPVAEVKPDYSIQAVMPGVYMGNTYQISSTRDDLGEPIGYLYDPKTKKLSPIYLKK